MLIIIRQVGEKIHIGENITITIVDSSSGGVRVGIEAPRDVPIYRQERLPIFGGEPEENAQ